MVYSKDDLIAIKSLVNPIDILTIFGGIASADLYDYGNEIRTYCPIHGGDNKSSFCWYKDTNSWLCYSKSCGNDTIRDVFNFVSIKLNIPFYDAVALVADLVGYKSNVLHPAITLKNSPTPDTLKIDKYKIESLSRLGGLPGYYKEGFDLVIKYLESRGYNYADLKKFNLYPHLDSCGLLRLGIPVYDDKNRLVGVNARLMDTIINYPNEVIDSFGNTVKPPKYKMVKFKKGSCLYNLNNAKESSLISGIIVVEGQLDVLRLYTYGLVNVVCTMGTSLTTKQVSLLYKYTYHVIFLVEEGEAAMSGILRSIKNLNNPMKISLAVLEKGDADSNTKEDIINVLSKSKTLSMRTIENVSSTKCL